MKNGDYDVNGLLLAGRVYPIFCFPHECVLYCRSKLTKNFDFELIVGFASHFLDCLKPWISFTRCLVFFFFGFLDQNIVENEICFGLEHHSLFFQWLEIAEIWLRQAICRLPQWYSEVSSNSMRQATRYLLFFFQNFKGWTMPLNKKFKNNNKAFVRGLFQARAPGLFA